MRIAAVLIFAVFAGNLTAAAQDQGNPKKKVGLSLKLSGGFGYLLNGAGDINEYRKGQQAILSDWYTAEGYTTTFDWPRPWFLPDLSADVIIHVGSHLGFGFGSGYVPGSSKGSYSISRQVSKTYWGYGYTAESKTDYRPDYRITAVPLKFDLYVFQSLGKADRFTFFAHAGVGYYWGRVKLDHHYQGTSKRTENYSNVTDSYFSDYQIDIAENAKCNTWGAQGGLGLELRLSRAISFGAEVCGRYVNFKNWTYQVHDDETQKNYTSMLLFEKRPNDEYYESLRKSAINLNAVSIALSLKVHFDLF